ncbi:hypothetical protein D3C85_1208180 [compost metagenome]
MAPAAKALAPESHTIGGGGHQGRPAFAIAHDRRASGGDIAKRCADAVIGGVADRVAVLKEGRLCRAMDLAGELVEACPNNVAVIGQERDRVIDGMTGV